MKIAFLTFSVFFLIFSCRSQENHLYEIAPPILVESNIFLSEIASDINYIPLENRFPIGTKFCLKINTDNIYLSIKDIGVVQFDRYGKFVRNIGHFGRGPGEYRGIYFTVDETNQRIYVLDQDKILVYSKDGTFLRDFSYKEHISGGAGGIEMFGSLIFLPDYSLDTDSKFNWIFLDTLGNLVSKKDNSLLMSKPGYLLRGDHYIFENTLFYFNGLNDTIFSISHNFKYKAAYIFSNNVRRSLKESWGNATLSQLNSLYRIGNMFETKHFVFLYYGYKDKVAFMLIDKLTKEISLAYEKEKIDGAVSTRASIKNDLDGGIALSISSSNQIMYYYVENNSEYIASFINPFDLKAYIINDEFMNKVPKYPDKKRDLEKFANSLKETDNPVLMILKLKH